MDLDGRASVCIRPSIVSQYCPSALQHHRHDSRGRTTYRNVLYQSTSPKELEKGAPQCLSTKKDPPDVFRRYGERAV